MTRSPDTRLDLWIETRLLRRARSKKINCPRYTRYTNRALLLLADIEMPFALKRRSDLKFEIQVMNRLDIADNWEDLAPAICELLYRVVEGAEWSNSSETSHGNETA